MTRNGKRMDQGNKYKVEEKVTARKSDNLETQLTTFITRTTVI